MTNLNTSTRADTYRLKLSSHRLAIETGRWHKPRPVTRNERKCILCNTLEDEFHFLLECELYKDLRIRYIKPFFRNRPNIPKMNELLSCEDPSVNRNLAAYTFKAMERRNTILY